MTRYILFFVLLTIEETTKPILYGLHLYRNQKAQVDIPQVIWALQDHHQLLPHLSSTQRIALLENLTKLPINDTIIITEDKFDAPPDNRIVQQIACDFYYPHDASILCGISHQLRSAGYHVANAECRFVHGVALQYLMAYVAEAQKGDCDEQYYQKIFDEYGLTVHAHIQETRKTIEHIKKRSSKSRFQTHLNTIISEIEDIERRMFSHAQYIDETITILAYYQHISEPEQKLFCKNADALHTAQVALFDANVITLLHEHANKKQAILIMGGAHIEFVLKLLTTQGYEHVVSYQINPELTEFADADQLCAQAQKIWLQNAAIQPLGATQFGMIGLSGSFFSQVD